MEVATARERPAHPAPGGRRSTRFQQLLHRSSGSLIAIAVLAAVLTSLAWQSGGYFPPAYLRAGAITFAALAGLLLLRPPQHRIATEALIALIGLLAFADWTALSTTWSASPPTGLENAQRDLVYVGIFAVAILAAGSGRPARVLVWSVLIAAMTIVVAGSGAAFFRRTRRCR